MAIKKKTKSGPVFTFNHITKEDVIKVIKNLDASKASQEDDVATKKSKKTLIYFPILYIRASITWLMFASFQHH